MAGPVSLTRPLHLGGARSRNGFVLALPSSPRGRTPRRARILSERPVHLPGGGAPKRLVRRSVAPHAVKHHGQAPRERHARFLQATALRDSTEALQTWVSEHPQDALAWGDLAATSGVLGLKLRAMRAAAEAQLSLGDLQGAIDRMRAAHDALAGRVLAQRHAAPRTIQANDVPYPGIGAEMACPPGLGDEVQAQTFGVLA